jgi:DNA-binding NarL/FixJ family response regulator
VPATAGQRALARDLVAQLDTAPMSSRPLREIVQRLPPLLGAEQTAAYLVRDRKLDFFHGARMPAGIRGAYERWLSSAPRKFAAYDPDRPEPRQRNVALRTHEIEALNGRLSSPVVRSFLPRFALSECDQLRALICDGPVLLAWVGGFRAGPFGRDAVRALNAVVPALQRRLSMERKLVEAQRSAQEIGGALESVPAGAFVLSGSGAVLHANAAGRAMLDKDRKPIEEQLRLGGPSVQLARLSADSDLRLAILSSALDPTPRVVVARARWQLTRRQTEVLALVAQGLSNRAIALSLECSESTVELHVSALLEKADCESRSQLVARLWSGG